MALVEFINTSLNACISRGDAVIDKITYVISILKEARCEMSVA